MVMIKEHLISNPNAILDPGISGNSYGTEHFEVDNSAVPPLCTLAAFICNSFNLSCDLIPQKLNESEESGPLVARVSLEQGHNSRVANLKHFCKVLNMNWL